MIAAAEVAYVGLAVPATARFAGRRRAPRREPSRVNPMVPLHGAPIGLEECPDWAYRQRCPGYQIVFGLHRHDDAAKPVVERLIAEHSEIGIALVNETLAGSNPKNRNLANMYPAAKHDIIAIVDGDVRVSPDFLAVVPPA
jgi:ceramide glucosyltransferase